MNPESWNFTSEPMQSPSARKGQREKDYQMESFWTRASPRGGSSPCSSLGLAVFLQEWKNTHVKRRLPDRRTEECQGWAGGRRRGGAKPSGAPDNRGAKGGSRLAAVSAPPRPGGTHERAAPRPANAGFGSPLVGGGGCDGA